MNVLVNGMDMPKNCGCCHLRFTKWCEARIYIETRPRGCPLVGVPTPHGRLIDADELKRNTMFIFSGTIREKEIDEATTIIEAEE